MLSLHVFTVKTCLCVLVSRLSRLWLIIMFHCDESIFLHTLNEYLRPHAFTIENVHLDTTLQPVFDECKFKIITKENMDTLKFTKTSSGLPCCWSLGLLAPFIGLNDIHFSIFGDFIPLDSHRSYRTLI